MKRADSVERHGRGNELLSIVVGGGVDECFRRSGFDNPAPMENVDNVAHETPHCKVRSGEENPQSKLFLEILEPVQQRSLSRGIEAGGEVKREQHPGLGEECPGQNGLLDFKRAQISCLERPRGEGESGVVDRIRDPVPALGFRQTGKVGPEGGVENLSQPVPRGQGPKIRGKNRLDGAPRRQEGPLGHGQQLFTEKNDPALIDRFQAEEGQN